MRPSQRPTATGVRVRSTRDANVLFHAVALNILPIVARRLDAADRAALRAGNVYVWEERAPAADATGAGMERFTEGRHWYPSRVRDDFLLYVEKDMEANEAAERARLLRRQRDPYASPTSAYGPPPPPARRAPLVKQTYSAWVNIEGSVRKWHMNAYYTEDALEQLLTVDDIPVLAGLHVPHECYQRARSSTGGTGKKAQAAQQAAAAQQAQQQQQAQTQLGHYQQHAPQYHHQQHAHLAQSAFPASVPEPGHVHDHYHNGRARGNSTASHSSTSASGSASPVEAVAAGHPRYAAYPVPMPTSGGGGGSAMAAGGSGGAARASLPPLFVPSHSHGRSSGSGGASAGAGYPPASPSPSTATSTSTPSSASPTSASSLLMTSINNYPARTLPTLVPLERLHAAHGHFNPHPHAHAPGSGYGGASGYGQMPLGLGPGQVRSRREPADDEILRSFRSL